MLSPGRERATEDHSKCKSSEYSVLHCSPFQIGFSQFVSMLRQSPRMMASRISDGFFPCLSSFSARRTSLMQISQPAPWLSR